MTPLAWLFAALIGIFFVLLAAKHVLKKEFCVLCASVSLTWLGFLMAYKLGRWMDPTPILVLMGGSVVGIYYLLDRRVRALWHVFRLPFFLTLVLAVLAVFYPVRVLVTPALLTAGAWFFMSFIYFLRHIPGVKSFFKQLLECCRNW